MLLHQMTLLLQTSPEDQGQAKVFWPVSIICATVAAFRTRGALSFMLASSAALDVLFWWLRNLGPSLTWYSALWPYAAGWMMLCRAAVVLTRCRPRMWPVLPALALHVWAGGFANVWPGSWLQAEEHAVGFCCMALGLTLAGSNAAPSVHGKSDAANQREDTGKYSEEKYHNWIIAALFVGTGAA